ncbi:MULTISPECIES: response regulator [Spirosoma]|uniref:Response regulator n=1 Tax=Spirosoma liriopis TaxID=2937440 RepID=A0ABT0HGN4_9BACT|nr:MULTISPECIES: response regulator [Spirosoma]MCK8491323.1 response regulator [Spirosoma liriopis]UHG90695.1 response regulator [Spirosoma oryzicola]
MSNFSNPLIYAVDDDEDDRYLLQCIFAEHFKECNLRVFENGSVLLTHLTHQLDGRLPDLILLDLEMPVFSGFDILRFLKCNEEYRSIPISILSALHNRDHIERCYELGTTSYLDKTQSYIQLVSSIQHLQHHWSETQTLKNKVGKKPQNLQKIFDLKQIPLN